jgi:5'-3' exonuclease
MNGYITENGKVNFQRLHILLSALGAEEEEYMYIS